MSRFRHLFPVAPIAELVEEEIQRRKHEGMELGGSYKDGLNQLYRTRGYMGPIDQVVSEISEFSGRSKEAVDRQIRKMRSGIETSNGKQVPYTHISLDYADDILCALGRPFYFYEHPDLREVYEQIGEEESPGADGKCAVCRKPFERTNCRKKFCSSQCRIVDSSRRFRAKRRREAKLAA